MEHPVTQNIRAIAELDRRVLDEQTAIDRLTGKVARAAGSMTFIVLHAVWFAGWIGLNATRSTFDRFPFSLLNLIVALEAVFLTSVVLLTQNHMTSVAERRARLELQVNLLAEQELTAHAPRFVYERRSPGVRPQRPRPATAHRNGHPEDRDRAR